GDQQPLIAGQEQELVPAGPGMRERVVAGVGAYGEREVRAVVEPSAYERGEEAGAVERAVDVDAAAAVAPPGLVALAGGRCGARVGGWSGGTETRWRLRFGVHARPVRGGAAPHRGGGRPATSRAGGPRRPVSGLRAEERVERVVRRRGCAGGGGLLRVVAKDE